MTNKPLTHEQAMRFAEVLAVLPLFPLTGSTEWMDQDEAGARIEQIRAAEVVQFPPQDWVISYACKLCAAASGSFPPPVKFSNGSDYLAHLNERHGPPKTDGTLWFDSAMPAYQGMLADAEACALGYLITRANLEGTGLRQMLCLRCNIRFDHPFFVKWRLCPACNRQYRNYYPEES